MFDKTMKRVLKSVLNCAQYPIRKWKRSALVSEIANRSTNGTLIRSVQELNLLLEAQAYINDQEIAVLGKYAKKAPGPLVEIGCAFGGSTCVLLSELAEGSHLTSIDPFLQDSMIPFRADPETCTRNVRKVMDACKMPDRLRCWDLLVDCSWNVARSWTHPLGLVFVDGDHRYEAVKRDVECWLPMLREGGFMILHDSRRIDDVQSDVHRRGWPGPTQVAREMRTWPGLELVDVAFSITVWQKRRVQ